MTVGAGAAAGLYPGTKQPETSQTSVPSSAMHQPWTHLLSLNPYHNAVGGAMYGPMLQQPPMSWPAGHFAVPQQPSNLPHGLSTHQVGSHVFPFASSSSLPQNQTYINPQPDPKPVKTTAAASKAQTARSADTQPTTKHIIVDIADTCLNLFPFAEVAKRHNQPEQKVRDIFAAVIQVPALRCPTDKRRAGKLGTARVKEFNQAKKDVQASHGPPRQDFSNQTPYTPSAWDIAQFMGPIDMRSGTFSQFSGPW
ncbi:hypothetical protein CCHL11_01072 [Colletotrichum chlorophyti]|uniref:Uncharacterized protein n=1 Tax=Colletotrichum chlorophyti TaxID=708187 RepID=A0A1Q8S7A3_9PEZI|nr:hypothetical protein CCHL11_01072 [Colletotrichum chlorophyti]